MLKCVKRIVATPFYLILLLLTFGTICLFIQWTLLDTKQMKMSAAIHHPLQFTENFLKRYDYDYIKCKRLDADATALEDFKRIKKSYLITLAELEEQEHIHMDQLEELQSTIQKMTDKIKQLNGKSTALKHKLLEQILKANELEARLIADERHLFRLIEEKNLVMEINPIDIYRDETRKQNKHSCNIDTCFNYRRCSLDTKLKVHVLDDSDSFFAHFKFKLEDLKQSVEFVSDPSESCLVLLSLRDM